MKSHAARARNAALLVLLLSLVGASAQEPLRPPANGPKRPDPAWHALVGATVHGAQDDATLLNTTVVLRNGVIVDVTTGPVPAGARVWDCAGLHVYPGLIDAYVEVKTPLPDSKDPGAHWNRRVTPRRRALDGAGLDAKTAQALREMGFCAAVLSPKGGTFRGRAALVSLAKPDKERSSARPPVLRDDVYQAVSFETGRRRDEDTYPNSQMGAIALMRQTLLDADWQALTRLTTNEQGAPNALDALAAGAAAAGPLLFDTRNELEALRAHAVAQEFGRPALLLGSGFEFRRLDAVAEAWKQAIVPLELPERPKVASIGEADAVDLRTLMTWEQAPTNPRRLQARGVLVALTTSKRKERSTFPESLRAAIRHGLDEEQALRMLTRNPAQILGVQDQLGSVERHKRANLVVSDGPLFAKGTKIRDVWIDGRRHEITPPPGASLEGEWT
ncbi:MAG: amidohydrolase family protein, partial [Planctomycetota bacterium]